MSLLAGIHPVLEALKADHPLDRVVVAKGAAGPRLQEIIELARKQKVPVRFEDRPSLDRLAKGTPHQGVIAFAAEKKTQTLAEILTSARMVVVLDGVEDPHNLGAIMRTAHAAGADAIVIPERRAAGVTPVVAKAAAGAMEYLSLVRVTNINRALEQLKEAGFWIYGLDERGTESYDTVEYTAPTVLVVGGEGDGLHQQVKKHCDVLIRIPLAGAISSLNVSVATGVALFEWKRRNPSNVDRE
jgi:23S rRNA (guanosine2251-2'-O)-methyltransferase